MKRILPVVLGSVLAAAAYWFGSPWLLWAGICILLPALLWLALRRRGLGLAVLLAVILTIGLGGALGLGPEPPDAPLILGLPRRAALLIYWVGLLPGLLFGVLFAIGFERLVLSRERLSELRDQLKQQ
jgi:hypothetical protein